MLCGVSTKWKQTVGYEFTANSFCANEIVQKITTIIQKAHDIGLTIKVIISDMGALNRIWWKILNITASKFSKINNSIQHPCDDQDRLFVMADTVHVYKNVACSLTSGKTFYVDETIMKRYNLSHKAISIVPIREVFHLDRNETLKLCLRLTEHCINPSHFEKMNAALSVAVLNNNVAAAILYHINHGRIADIHKTTAWFLTIIHKWFKIMTSYEKLALSHSNEYTMII
ncbi:uncharacterized protein LOC112589802 [Harpegnathos saltator]|uniref:uncharacterized protein LOC112589802 n=1 Tax=Harpegnathos saltator TaxID=610380 RepID=UPI000DBEE1AB|nr:uncharacterized protein LOC112589802 [Harpegnathos saltator]